jgi:hypothetical protein
VEKQLETVSKQTERLNKKRQTTPEQISRFNEDRGYTTIHDRFFGRTYNTRTALQDYEHRSSLPDVKSSIVVFVHSHNKFFCNSLQHRSNMTNHQR